MRFWEQSLLPRGVETATHDPHK